MEQHGSLSAIDLYMNRLFRTLIIMIPLIALVAGLTFSTIKLLGFYAEVDWKSLLLFDLSCVFYFIIGLLFLRHCADESGLLRPHVLRYGKIFLAFLIIVQWNFISYMIPSRDFWAYSLFFVMLVMPFLDHRFVLFVELEVGASIFISWAVKGDALLPAADEFYIPNMILRVVLLALGFLSLWFTTYLMERRLVTELERVAEIDTLTLLRNRRSMEQALKDAVKRANETGQGFTLLMCDLDDFKHINDTYGHKCGDEVLKFIASLIIHDVKENDQVFRFGGEEILLLIDADEKTAQDVAERICNHIRKSSLLYEGKSISVTLTIGAARYRMGYTPEELIRAADAKLYQGKRSGKNQVVV